MSAPRSTRLVNRWPRTRLPAPTIRLRLTLVYGGLFLCSAAALLAITYVLVHHQYTGSFFISSGHQAAVQFQSSGNIDAKPVPGFEVPIGPNAIAGSRKVAIAAAQGQSDAALHKLFVDSAAALAVMAVLSLWLGWVIAGRALRPIRTITETARDISASSLHRRLALEGPDDELKQLGNTVDGLLARLEISFEAQRQFVANASHELRTPLTLERTLLEVALSDPNASIDSYRRTCEQLLAVGEQQERLIEALLTLSRSQRGLDSRQPVDLAAITATAAAAADHDGLVLDTDAPAGTDDRQPTPRRAARRQPPQQRHPPQHRRRQRQHHNRNARRSRRPHRRQHGPHDPGERARTDLPALPTTRSRPRQQRANGLGLGLSIVQAIANAHGATITTHAQADGGLQIQISFPAERTLAAAH